MDEPDHSFDLLVLDAFSSDAIPIHLLTAEAFALYERKLAPNGVILMHLSNRYRDLVPVVSKIAQSAEVPLNVRENDDTGISDREAEDGKYRSIWVALARKDEDFGPLNRPLRGFLPSRLRGPLAGQMIERICCGRFGGGRSNGNFTRTGCRAKFTMSPFFPFHSVGRTG